VETQKFLFDLTLPELHVAIHIGSICLTILPGPSIFQLESILVVSEISCLVVLFFLQLLLLSYILLNILVSFLEVEQNHLRSLLKGSHDVFIPVDQFVSKSSHCFFLLDFLFQKEVLLLDVELSQKLHFGKDFGLLGIYLGLDEI
jgi:hypothetical protein